MPATPLTQPRRGTQGDHPTPQADRAGPHDVSLPFRSVAEVIAHPHIPVDHTFTLRNSGEYTTDVDLTLTGVPTGWTAELRGPRVSNNAIEDLSSMEVVDVTLRVGAPSSSRAAKVAIKVRD